MKGLMDWCTSHETVITRLRKKVEAKDSELKELTAWKDVQDVQMLFLVVLPAGETCWNVVFSSLALEGVEGTSWGVKEDS